MNTAPASAPIPVKKMGKFRASYLLTVEGFELIKKDKHIFLFPLLSLLANLTFLVIFFVGYFLITGSFDPEKAERTSDFGYYGYIITFFFYLIGAFILAFFDAGLTLVVDARINGRSMTFEEGMDGAKAHIQKIFIWSLVSATVGIILKIISDKSKWVGKLVAALLHASWGIVTFFIVPALMLEEGKVSDAIKSSANTFKKTWGETIIINFSTGLFLGVLTLLTIIVFAIGIFVVAPFVPAVLVIPALILVAVLIGLFLLGLGIFSHAVDSVLRVVLFEYSKTGRLPDSFAPELILGMLKKQEAGK